MFPKRKQRSDTVGVFPAVMQSAAVRGLSLAISILAVMIGASVGRAQTITTVAGNGVAGFLGDGGQATSASFNNPRGIAFDSSGNMYIADVLNHRIRRVTPSGTISTFAGTGVPGFSGDGGAAVSAQLNQPEDVLVDAGGNVYIADSSNHRVRRVSAGGTISTVAGTGGAGFTGGYNGDNILATNAFLNRPTAIAMDASGNFYIADSSNHRVRKVSVDGSITTAAGNGVQAYSGEGVLATTAALRFPLGVALDSGGNLYIADAGNHVVRRVSTGGIINTVAGNGAGAGSDTGSFSGDGGAAISAGLNTCDDVVVDSSGTIFISDRANYRIRKVSGGVITTFAGAGGDGFSGDGGAAIAAQFNLPWSITLDASGNLLIGDLLNQRIRRISPAGSAPPPVGTGGGTGGGPSVSSGGVVNGASFRPSNGPNGAVAAGTIVSVFGQNLATTTASATSYPLPTNLAGTSVTFSGITAPLFAVSSSQINLQVPFNVSGGTGTIQVTNNGVTSTPQNVSLAPFSPGVFTQPPGGTGAGAILHAENFAVVSASAPARVGEFLLIFCTGLGPVQPSVLAGSMAPANPPASTITTVTTSIAGIPANVIFAGLAPGFAGLYQVNVQVPPGTPAGSAISVVVAVGGVVANTVTIAVQ